MIYEREPNECPGQREKRKQKYITCTISFDAVSSLETLIVTLIQRALAVSFSVSNATVTFWSTFTVYAAISVSRPVSIISVSVSLFSVSSIIRIVVRGWTAQDS